MWRCSTVHARPENSEVGRTGQPELNGEHLRGGLPLPLTGFSLPTFKQICKSSTRRSRDGAQACRADGRGVPTDHGRFATDTIDSPGKEYRLSRRLFGGQGKDECKILHRQQSLQRGLQPLSALGKDEALDTVDDAERSAAGFLPGELRQELGQPISRFCEKL